METAGDFEAVEAGFIANSLGFGLASWVCVAKREWLVERGLEVLGTRR